MTSSSTNLSYENPVFSPEDGGQQDFVETEIEPRSPSTTAGSQRNLKLHSKPGMNKCSIAILVMSSLSAAMSFAMLVGGYQAMFDAILHSQMAIKPGSKSYEIWKETPFPLILSVYFFNITNPRAFQRGAKPILKEVGPFSYREYHEKKNVTFYDNNTVSYLQERWWVWDQENSKDNSPDDVICTINTIPISSTWSVKNILPARESLNELMNEQNETLIIYPTAGDILFNGVDDAILEWMQDNVLAENSTFHSILPFLPPGVTDYDKFGWFYMRNHSLAYDGLFNMFTGEDSLDNLGKIDMWNQNRQTKFFDGPCGKITGSAGEMWPPNLEKRFVDFYSSDLCTSMKLYYKGEMVDRNGLRSYRYWGNEYSFSNGSVTPGHECYCVKGTCAPYGLINSESCRMGSPSFVSFPHFLNADQFLLQQVKGMNPDEERHAFVMDLLPELGTPINVAARMQINMYVRPYQDENYFGKKIGGIDILKKVKPVYLPLMWFEVLAGVPDDMAGQLKALQFMMRSNTMYIVFAVLLTSSLISILVVVLCNMRKTIRAMAVKEE